MIKRFLLLLCLFCTACAPQSYQQVFHAFGTNVTVDIAGVSKEVSAELFVDIDEQLHRMHQRWHAWQDSELLAIQKACQTGETIQVSEDVAYLLTLGQHYEEQSLGYFNPAAGELIALWGFLSHQHTQSRAKPDMQAIQAVLAQKPSMQNLIIHEQTVFCNNPSLRLDFGAYAKGYGVALIIDYLKSQGVKQALVNAGGDITFYQEADARARRIAIQSPFHQEPIGILQLTNEASVFTSGTYTRQFKDNQTEEIFHHLINPHTGHPSTTFVSVTVIHEDPVTADVAATALLASDAASWLDIVGAMSLDKYLLITQQGEKIASPNMQQLMTTRN